jgi:hypothetical protein
VRATLARILFSVAVGLLFGHQFIAHHHEDSEITSKQHDDNDDANHHQDHFPAHYIAHVFSFDNAQVNTVQTQAHDISFNLISELILPLQVQLVIQKEYIEIRPPLIRHYKYFSLRAPPTA